MDYHRLISAGKDMEKKRNGKGNGGENEGSPPFLTFGGGGEVAGMKIKGYLCGMEANDERKGFLLWQLANAKRNGYESFVYDTLTGMWHGNRKLLRYHDIRLQELNKESRCLRKDVFDTQKELDTLKRRWRRYFALCFLLIIIANVAIWAMIG